MSFSRKDPVPVYAAAEKKFIPYTELDYNRDNYMEAVQMLGGTDNESVDLFWTKKD